MTRTARDQFITLATVLAFALTACTATTTTFRHRVPLYGPQAAEARHCVKRCEMAFIYNTDREGALQCWDKCPGAEVSNNQHCGPEDRQPNVACEELDDTKSAPINQATSFPEVNLTKVFLYAAVGFVVLFGMAAASATRH